MRTVKQSSDTAERMDITAAFTDPRFLERVYNVIGKNTHMPIHLTDVDKIESLKCMNYGIKSLSGLEYFISLKRFDCSGNKLMELPELPRGLVMLNCSGNSIKSLPPLPSRLARLDCCDNHITEIPELSPGLIILDCAGNRLSALPSLPESINILSCGGNELEEWPHLPSGLVMFFCSNMMLTELPPLPTKLKVLNCYDNLLTELPALPSTLKDLAYHGNPFIKTALHPLNYSLHELMRKLKLRITTADIEACEPILIRLNEIIRSSAKTGAICDGKGCRTGTRRIL